MPFFGWLKNNGNYYPVKMEEMPTDGGNITKLQYKGFTRITKELYQKSLNELMELFPAPQEKDDG